MLYDRRLHIPEMGRWCGYNDGYSQIANDTKTMKTRTSLLLAALLALSLSAFADGPAVSAINGKVSIEGGNFDGNGGQAIQAAIAAPLGNSFGLQLDTAFGSANSKDFSGFGGHAFWRDPARGLLGVTASTLRYDNLDVRRYGAEAEGYFGAFTLRGRAGYQNSDWKDGAYYSLGARWYATQDIMVSVSGERSVNRNIGHVSAEWQISTPSLPGLALFLDAAKGSNDFDMATVGVRYYFGANKSLIQRHRQDDPDNLLIEAMTSGQQQYQQRKDAAAAAAVTPACPPMSVACI